MQIPNPYTYNVLQNSKLIITTKPIPSGRIKWTTYRDYYNRLLLQATFEFTVPKGITAVQFNMDIFNGSPVAEVRIKSLASNRYWFDNVNITKAYYPVIGVTPNKTYHLSIGSPAPIDKNGDLYINYSYDINNATKLITDLE